MPLPAVAKRHKEGFAGLRVNRHLHVNVKHAFNQLRATDIVVANRAGDAPLFKEYQQIGVVHRKVKVMEHRHHRAAMFAGEGLEQLKDIDLIAQIERWSAHRAEWWPFAGPAPWRSTALTLAAGEAVHRQMGEFGGTG